MIVAPSRPIARQNHTRGAMVVLVLVFSAVFLATTGALSGYIFVQHRLQAEKELRERALQIAEAGIDYYKWFLAHFPGDITDGTGQPGPYVHSYADPEGGTSGTFSLEIDGNVQCGVTTAIDITSTGKTTEDPTFSRVVSARYARPSVAEFAYIVNTNVWAGADRVITGKYHSNGGVRMDGDNLSSVTSSVSTWQCTSSFGCSPTQTVAGVFGSGTNPTLWSYPTPQVDFGGITVDLNAIKNYARNQGGLYFGPAGGESNKRGYQFIFKNDSTIDAYRVTNTTEVWGYTTEDGWQKERNIIANKTFLGNYAIPANCSVIFAEDRLWIEGVIVGKVTVASADISQPNHDTDIILSNNITYLSNDGTNGLTVVAERNILIPLDSPQDMSLHGIFIAQTGRYGRNHYTTSGSNDVPSSYDSFVQQGTLTTIGTIVSNGRTGTQWTCGGSFCSGYQNRIDSYDGRLASDPPPFTPYTSSDYTFIEWREEN